MADKFLLPCPKCEKATPVTVSQAGSTLQCDCGNELEIPTIRRIRELELVSEGQQQVETQWSARSGAIFFGAIFTIFAALPGVYLLVTWPEAPVRDVPASIEMAEKSMSEWPIDRSWLYWYDVVELRGLTLTPEQAEIAYLEETTRRRWFCCASFGFAAIGLAFLLTALARPAKT